MVLCSEVDHPDEHAICERYKARILAYGLRHLRDRVAAQDLVQHVLLAVLQALRAGRVEDQSRLDAYVLGTCRNAAMDMRRAEMRQRRIAQEAASFPAEYEPPTLSVDRLRLEQCLRGLEPRDRAIVVATFLEDRGADEIARAMSLTPTNVRVIRHRALAKLQICIEGQRS